MQDFQPIATERLLIRKLERRDEEAFFAYHSLPEVCRHQTFRPSGGADVHAFFGRLSKRPDVPGTWFQLAVCLQNEDRLIGDIGLHFLEDGEQAEIGYTLAPHAQGNGYALEAVRAVMGYLFGSLRKHRVVASVDPENVRSVRLLGRLGMRREAHFVKGLRIDGAWADECVYAMLREDWQP